VSLFNVPVLPQNDTPTNRAARAQELIQKQTQYQYDYPSIVGGLPMAATPIPVDISVDWAIQVAEVAITLGENLVSILLPNVFSFDVQIPITLGGSSFSTRSASGSQPVSLAVPTDAIGAEPEIKRLALDLQGLLSSKRKELGKMTERAHAQKTTGPAPGLSIGGEIEKVAEHAGSSLLHAAEHAGSSLLHTAESSLSEDIADARDIGSWLAKLVKRIFDAYLSAVGLLGRAKDLQQYTAQFRKLALPESAGLAQEDSFFASLRVAGPNPIVLRRATAADLDAFPATDEQFASVTGEPGATVKAAVAAGSLYLVDYSVLSAIQPGTSPQQKYLTVPKALFYVPSEVESRRALRPFAIQIGQEATSPIFYPSDGLSWSLAKICVNTADVNYHELISHLGLTHLLTEPFVIATERQLDPQHPLNILLTPHFAGTLFINYAAQTSLISPGGPVDLLLAGTIATSNGVAASAVKAVRYNESFLPLTLAFRGVDSREALPDYPYRDDALTLWNALRDWVSDYVGIYYSSDGDVSGDYELQAWVQELVTSGHIQDIGEGAPGEAARIATIDYLVTLLTQVIFTASVEHAAVNFPQRTIMSYTPATPLAGFAAFPAAAGAPETTVLDILPPLNESALQQAVGAGLGGVYHTVLGQYGGQIADPRALIALLGFQKKLLAIEEQIHAANARADRTSYLTLLPSAIPQSINI